VGSAHWYDSSSLTSRAALRRTGRSQRDEEIIGATGCGPVKRRAECGSGIARLLGPGGGTLPAG
jgi:hypothetical protein